MSYQFLEIKDLNIFYFCLLLFRVNLANLFHNIDVILAGLCHVVDVIRCMTARDRLRAWDVIFFGLLI